MSETEELLERAWHTLEAARSLFEDEFYADSISRAYYAVFYAAEAALLSEGVTAKTHKGTHMLFRKHFIKTDALPVALSTHLSHIFKARQSADYGSATKTREEAKETLQKATDFIERIEAYLREQS